MIISKTRFPVQSWRPTGHHRFNEFSIGISLKTYFFDTKSRSAVRREPFCHSVSVSGICNSRSGLYAAGEMKADREIAIEARTLLVVGMIGMIHPNGWRLLAPLG